MYEYEGEYTHYWACGDTNPMGTVISTLCEDQKMTQ